MKTCLEKYTLVSCNIAQQHSDELQNRLDKTAKPFAHKQFNISDTLTTEQRAEVETLLYEFRDIWSYSPSDIGVERDYKQKLLVDKSIQPFAHKTREVPVNILFQIKRQIDDLTITGVL